jgi:uncharacterized repeat protein (TIGR03803 family)
MLARDAAGDIFGISAGGANGAGIVFELAPQPGKRKWKYSVLHEFCHENGCLDGEQAASGKLVVDVNGNVYGATNEGGAAGSGVAYELSPNGTGGWTYSKIYDFCSKDNCHDGGEPVGNLTYDGAQAGLLYNGRSRLYGAAAIGGGHFSGVAYSLTPQPAGPWSENVLYAFCARDLLGCPDGASPLSGLTLDAAGSLFGNTSAGGAADRGVAFKLVAPPARHEGPWTETVLHSYCILSNCADGSYPESELVEDGSGNLYGTTTFGGGSPNCFDVTSGCGVLYEIAADGTYSVLHVFCTLSNCVDGGEPQDRGGLALDALGNLFGVTASGDANALGGIFEFSSATFQVLYDFCSRRDCSDGGLPLAGLQLDSAGNLFGSTVSGGRFNRGTLFDLSPLLTPTRRAFSRSTASPLQAAPPAGTASLRRNSVP